MTEVETTCCTKCDTELEAGQTGLCEDCESARPRPFDELSEKAKQKAREDYTSGDYPGDEWWDAVYEDAVRMGKMLGITIDETKHKTSRGHEYTRHSIYFSGFCSQGDGACFEGSYEPEPDAIKKITEETGGTDEELLRIAQGLTALQITHRLRGLNPYRANIKSRGNDSHSGTIYIDVHVDDVDDDNDLTAYSIEDLENSLLELMRDFADWIHRQLDDENDYLHSDEYVDEQLSESDCMFDESGAII